MRRLHCCHMSCQCWDWRGALGQQCPPVETHHHVPCQRRPLPIPTRSFACSGGRQADTCMWTVCATWEWCQTGLRVLKFRQRRSGPAASHEWHVRAQTPHASVGPAIGWGEIFCKNLWGQPDSRDLDTISIRQNCGVSNHVMMLEAPSRVLRGCPIKWGAHLKDVSSFSSTHVDGASQDVHSISMSCKSETSASIL